MAIGRTGRRGLLGLFRFGREEPVGGDLEVGELDESLCECFCADEGGGEDAALDGVERVGFFGPVVGDGERGFDDHLCGEQVASVTFGVDRTDGLRAVVGSGDRVDAHGRVDKTFFGRARVGWHGFFDKRPDERNVHEQPDGERIDVAEHYAVQLKGSNDAFSVDERFAVRLRRVVVFKQTPGAVDDTRVVDREGVLCTPPVALGEPSNRVEHERVRFGDRTEPIASDAVHLLFLTDHTDSARQRSRR